MAKKNSEPKVSERITPSATEISVARNGFLKPYVACFQALPDNIAREPLGLLAGVFSIGDRSDHSAYIVNFLTSLAKKEYYGNPRRDAVESFESCLHKINLGLSELAKEGNTEWIGTLDAALCAVERNNLHFSVAGNARVLLLRENRLSNISDGLVEIGERHPMKTFTDVASGKICSGDRLIITTPELFSALSESDLERAARRLPGEQFERFLRTAAVNQLDISATVLIDIRTVEEYQRPIAPKRSLASENSIPNAWSRSIFETSKQQGNSVEETLAKQKEERERIDKKTGHIYITGESSAETPDESWERARIFWEDAQRILARIGHIVHAGAIRIWREIVSAVARSSFVIGSSLRRWIHRQTQHAEPPSVSDDTIVHLPIQKSEIPSNPTRFSFQKIGTLLKTFFKREWSVWSLLPPKIRYIAIASLILLVVFLLIFTVSFLPKTETPPEIPLPESQLPENKSMVANPMDSEKNVVPIGDAPIIFHGENIVSLAQLDTALIVLTERSLFRSKSEGGESIQIDYPEAAQAIRAVAFPDLNGIAILTADNSFLFYTPANNQFTKERADSFPDIKRLSNIAAFTTYLYTADAENNTITRSPRIQGGFGPGISWLKEPVDIMPDTAMIVGEFLSLADANSIRVFSRGLQKDIVFESPNTPLIPTALALSETADLPLLFVLDGTNGRIVEYDRTHGTLRSQYTSDSLKGATHFVVDPNNRLAMVATKNTVMRIPLQ